MKLKYLSILCFILLFSCTQENKKTAKLLKDYLQNINPKNKTVYFENTKKLPNKLKESSGLAIYQNDIFSINDSGDKPIIYRMRKSDLKIIQKIEITNIKNRDWEDLAIDNHYLYIAETGNNLESHKALYIYKINLSELNSEKKVKVKAGVIEFKYKNQKEYSNNKNTNFDCEAIAVEKNTIHLLTKEHKSKKTTHYTLKNSLGKQIAAPKESLEINELVTSSDLKNNTFIFTTLTKVGNIFIYKSTLKNGLIFNSSLKKFNAGFMGKYGQVEAICFDKNESFYISNEKFKKSIFEVDAAIHQFKF